MFYFAYGSNMCWAQVKERCPSARFLDIALLRDHRIAFTRRSVTRGCGVADAVQEPGGKVWGVVFAITEFDIGQLDKSEGYHPGREKNSYWRRDCTAYVNGDENRPLTVSTYFGDQQQNPPLPSQAYKGLILSGARHWHLPGDYIAQLEQIEVSG